MELRELSAVDAIAIDNARYARVQSPPSNTQDWSEFFSRPANHGWGLFLDDKLCGTIFLQADPRHPTHVILSGLWVDKAHRNAGFGQQLVECALEYADAECYCMAKLWVSEHNHSAASLYRSMDFAPTGRLRASAYDPFDHLEQLALNLRQEAALQT